MASKGKLIAWDAGLGLALGVEVAVIDAIMESRLSSKAIKVGGIAGVSSLVVHGLSDGLGANPYLHGKIENQYGVDALEALAVGAVTALAKHVIIGDGWIKEFLMAGVLDFANHAVADGWSDMHGYACGKLCDTNDRANQSVNPNQNLAPPAAAPGV